MTIRVFSLYLAVALTGACTAPPDAIRSQSAATVRVGLLEWEITTDAAAVEVGEVTFRVTNAGATAHDLAVDVGAGNPSATRLLPAGETATLVVDVTDTDEVALWCTVAGHRRQGMESQLQVRP